METSLDSVVVTDAASEWEEGINWITGSIFLRKLLLCVYSCADGALSNKFNGLPVKPSCFVFFKHYVI